jgi:hypothetical protein
MLPLDDEPVLTIPRSAHESIVGFLVSILALET